MTAIAIERETNNYWGLIMNASAEIKLALIARLSNSLMSESLRKQSTAENLIASIQANAPKDVPLTDQEIQEEINAVRFGR